MNARKLWKTGRIAVVIGVILMIGMSALGCVKGLTAVGWSGGTVSDGVLYVGSREGQLVAVNLDDTSRMKAEALKGSSSSGLLGCNMYSGGGCSSGSNAVAIYGTPVVADGIVYMAGYNGKVFAYKAENLATIWSYPREGTIEHFVGGAVVDDGTVYVGGEEGKTGVLYALDAATGDLKWSYEAEDKIWATPAVAGDTVYIGSFDKKLYAIDKNSGTLRWEFVSDGAIYATPLVVDGTVYIGSFDRNMYALNAADGSKKWAFTGSNWFWTAPVLIDTTLYAGCLDGYMYIINAVNGNEIAAHDLQEPLAAGPVVAGDNVIFANKEGVLYRVNTQNNNVSKLVDAEMTVYGHITVDDNIVYIQSETMTVVRVNVETGALMGPLYLSD